MIAAERLYLTADADRLVREDDGDAAFLYAVPGDEIPESAVERFGLIDGKLPPTLAEMSDAVARQAEADEAAAKAAADAGKANKEAKGGADKEAAPGQDKAG